jgi:hypothetical protein
MRREYGALPYDILKGELCEFDTDVIESWAEELDPMQPIEDGPTPPTANVPSTPPASATPTAHQTPTSTAHAPLETAERWFRVPLVPGLELMMLEGSGELVSRLASEIQGKYRATGKAT